MAAALQHGARGPQSPPVTLRRDSEPVLLLFGSAAGWALSEYLELATGDAHAEA